MPVIMPSTVVSAFTYDTDRSVLRVVFVSGMIYEYRNVPVKVYKSMKEAPSKGIFLNTKIKGRYPFEKVKILLYMPCLRETQAAPIVCTSSRC